MIEAYNIRGGRAFVELEALREERQTSINVTQLAIAFPALLVSIVAGLISRSGKHA